MPIIALFKNSGRTKKTKANAKEKRMISAKDTTLLAEKILIDGYRKMSPERKLKQVTILTQTVQRMALARLQKQYPKMTLHEQKLRLASLWLPRETMIKHFNWDPKEMGY
jgi:hypothetical protein